MIARFAIIMPTWVGDTVMATPVVRAVRAALPGAEITLLVRPGLDTLLAGLPDADRVLVHPLRGLLGPASGGRLLRSARPETVLVLPNSMRSALVARFSGAPNRIGYRREGRGVLLTRAIAPSGTGPVPAVDWYADLAETALGGPVSDRRPRLHVTDEERHAAAPAVAAANGAYVVCHPGANRDDKRWPAERFAAVADHLMERWGLPVIATGSAAERPVVDRLRDAATSEVIDGTRFGLDLGGLKAIVAGARLMITNDTGPRHIAAALSVPTVTLFGPTDHRWTTLPIPGQRLLVAEPFLPAELVADRHPRACAIDRITEADACHAVDALLETDAPADSAAPVARRP